MHSGSQVESQMEPQVLSGSQVESQMDSLSVASSWASSLSRYVDNGHIFGVLYMYVS